MLKLNIKHIEKMSSNSLLRDTIAHGFIYEIKELIGKGVDDGYLLTMAVDRGDITIIKLLIEAGIDVCSYYNSALKRAVERRSPKIVELLIDKGADVNARNGCALSIASEKGYAEIAEILIKNNAKIEDYHLNDAVIYDHIEVVKLFIRSGISANNYDILSSAIKNSRYQIAKFLIENGAGAYVNDPGLLNIAIQERSVECVRLLFEKGVTVSKKKLDSMTYEALGRDDLNLAMLFIEYGADVNSRGGYALYLAVSDHCYNAIRNLIKRGADVNIKDNFPIKHAAVHGELEMAKILIDNGADIHVENDVALFLAVEYNNFDFVVFLIGKGADVHSSNGRALKSALRRGHHRIVNFLSHVGMNYAAPLELIDTRCCVCLEEADRVTVECSHLICNRCYTSLPSIPACPMCRHNNITVTFIFPFSHLL